MTRRLSVAASALKHSYTEEDIRHALEHVHIKRRVFDDDPPRTWIFGFARDAALLEIMVLHFVGRDLVIHCMKARSSELAKALKARGSHD